MLRRRPIWYHPHSLGPPPKEINMGLNEPQQRRIEVTLSLIEQTLLELEKAYLTDTSITGEMFRVTSDLTPAEVQTLGSLFYQMRQHIGRLREQFQLKPQERDLRRMLAAAFAHCWAILHDCRTDKLKGSGRVDPRLKQTLDPTIDQLIKLVEKMERLTRGG
jgi:hypothetical protein